MNPFQHNRVCFKRRQPTRRNHTPPAPFSQTLLSSQLPTKPCRLLALPAELRKAIFSYALASNNPIKYQLSKLGPEKFPPLTRTNHQIRNETIPIFYRLNTLRFDSYHRILYPGDAAIVFDPLTPHVPLFRHIELGSQYATGLWRLDLSRGLREYKLTMGFEKKERDEGVISGKCCMTKGKLRRGKKMLDETIAKAVEGERGLRGVQLAWLFNLLQERH